MLQTLCRGPANNRGDGPPLARHKFGKVEQLLLFLTAPFSLKEEKKKEMKKKRRKKKIQLVIRKFTKKKKKKKFPQKNKEKKRKRVGKKPF